MKLNKILLTTILAFSFIMLLGVSHAATTNYDIIKLNADTYNYNPAPVTAGKNVTLWIQLTNNSNTTAYDVQYYLDAKYPFTVLDKINNREISKLGAYQTKTIKYTLQTNKLAVDGTYDLDFKVRRKGIDNYSIKTLKIDIKGASAIVDIVNSNVEQASMGGDSQISLDLKNLGQKNAQDIFITLGDSTDSMVKVIGLKTQYINHLNIDSQNTVNFKINVSKDATKTSYSLPITIKYSDDDSTYTTNRNVGIQIVDNPKMIVNITSSQLKFSENAEATLSLEVYNTGSVDAESVYVEIKSNVNKNIPSYFIGTIEKNNYDTADFKFKVNAKPGTYPATIIVHYKDSNLKDQEITETVNLQVTNENSNITKKIINIILGIIIGIVLLALLIIIIKWLIKIIVKPAIIILKNLFLRK